LKHYQQLDQLFELPLTKIGQSYPESYSAHPLPETGPGGFSELYVLPALPRTLNKILTVHLMFQFKSIKTNRYQLVAGQNRQSNLPSVY